MLVDYHWHTTRCGHASGTMQEYLNVARAKGLTEVGFADHIPMYWLKSNKIDPELAMSTTELPEYLAEVELLRRTNLDINIKLGLEVDFIPGHEATAKKILTALPLDYVLGSVHYLNDWGFDNPHLIHHYQEWDLLELYHCYFEQIRAAASSGLFDIIAHPDLIKKFGYRPQKEITEIYRQTARVFADSEVCVEINTAGLRVPAQEIYPSLAFLKLLHRYKVPVTTGSDAHKPEHVGQGFKEALQLLELAGYREITIFNKRQKSYCKI